VGLEKDPWILGFLESVNRSDVSPTGEVGAVFLFLNPDFKNIITNIKSFQK